MPPTGNHDSHSQQAREKVQSNIDLYGCHLVLIEEDNYLPAFVYSIGLFQKFGCPEIICFGMNTTVMAGILNHACDFFKKGEQLTTYQLYPDFLEGYSIQFIPVDVYNYPDYMGYAGWFYNMKVDFPVWQLVWPDKQHFFPWEPDFNPHWKYKQPLLDRNADFKFYEPKNLGVYSTRQFLNGEPILYVYHNEDGDWQFHTSAEPNMDDAVLLCLEEVIKIDPSINQLFNLQYGWCAWREDRSSEWQYEESPDEENPAT